MNFNAQTAIVSTWIGIAASIGLGFVWAGNITSDVATNKKTGEKNAEQIDKVRDSVSPTQTAIATLNAKMESVQTDLQDIKQTNREILSELRKK